MIFTTEQLKSMTPVVYAVGRNAERAEQAAERGWSFWTTVPTSQEWHAKQGYKTAYDYVRAVAVGELSDLYKEMNLHRPSFTAPLGDMDLTAINAEISRLVDLMNMNTD